MGTPRELGSNPKSASFGGLVGFPPALFSAPTHRRSHSPEDGTRAWDTCHKEVAQTDGDSDIEDAGDGSEDKVEVGFHRDGVDESVVSSRQFRTAVIMSNRIIPPRTNEQQDTRESTAIIPSKFPRTATYQTGDIIPPRTNEQHNRKEALLSYPII